MTTESSHGITAQDVYAYFDGELSGGRATAVEKALEQDPELRREHAQLGGLHETVVASLDAEADALPPARFEQIWDEIDRAIARDSRLQAEADRGASIWTRMWNAIAPVRVPMFAAAGAAAVTLVVVSMSGDDEANKTPAVASVDETAEQPKAANTPPSTPPQPDRIAQVAPELPPKPDAELTPMPIPETSDVEIHGIEFGGKSGSISNSGTVTVLYVEEDVESTNSERSL